MTFVQRLANSGLKALVRGYSAYFIGGIRDALGHHCEEVSTNYIETAVAERFPHIVLSAIGFEFPRTLHPLTEYVGPILPQSFDPVPDNLLSWMDSRKSGTVVYVSMGSVLHLSNATGRAIAEGLLETRHSILWSLPESNRDFLSGLDTNSDRIYLSKWIPQLSVLRHEAVGMAILHGGFNGVSEALASAVPLIVLPSNGDQFAIAARVRHCGAGISLHPNSITSGDISGGVATVMTGGYRRAAERMSVIFELAGGVERAADLVEFYAEVGYDHLVPAYAKYEWTWVQYYNVDVYATLVGVACVGVGVLVRVCRCVLRRCCRARRKDEQE